MVQQLKEPHADEEQHETFEPLEQSKCEQAFIASPFVPFIPFHPQLPNQRTG
jgi:hypothetical protein